MDRRPPVVLPFVRAPRSYGQTARVSLGGRTVSVRAEVRPARPGEPELPILPGYTLAITAPRTDAERAG